MNVTIGENRFKVKLCTTKKSISEGMMNKRFDLKDRWSRDKSIEMFTIWRDYHHSSSGYEKIARNWNGGADGYKKKSTEKYWEKVSYCLETK